MVTTTCTLLRSDLTKSTPLINCTIRAFNMSLGQSYKIKVTAIHAKDPTLTATKTIHIDTASPTIKVAYIEGCGRLFSTSSPFNLEAMITTNSTFARFTWFCTDTLTGSPCFTTTYTYITIANTKKVVIPGNQLFPNNTYLFKVNVQDTLSQTVSSHQCFMYSVPKTLKVMSMIISTEVNRNGFIDFNAQMAAFKVQILEYASLNKSSLVY